MRSGVSEIRLTLQQERGAGLTLSSHKSIESHSFGDEKLGASSKLDKVLGSIIGENVDLVAMFSLETFRVFLRSLNRFKIVLQFNLLGESLLLWIVTAKEIWFCSRRAQDVRQVFVEKTNRGGKRSPINRIPV